MSAGGLVLEVAAVVGEEGEVVGEGRPESQRVEEGAAEALLQRLLR